jgi:hypothetical protein
MHAEFWWGNFLENIHLEDKEEDKSWTLWRRFVRTDVDETGSGLFPVAGFGISGVLYLQVLLDSVSN